MFNLAVAACVHAAIFVGLRAHGLLVDRGWVTVDVGRKTSHVLLGALVLVSWLAYDDGPSARWLAALPLVVVGAYFAGLGLGLIRDERTVRGASRSGRRYEMLLGPLLYCASAAPLPILFWRSPVAVAAFAFLIFGDALGEVVGRRVPSRRLPWNRRKSVAGTAAVLAGGWVGCLAVFTLFASRGFLDVSAADAWARLLVVCAAGAAAESATPGSLDNVAAVSSCALIGSVVF